MAEAAGEVGEDGIGAPAVGVERRLQGPIVHVEVLAGAQRIAAEELGYRRRRPGLGPELAEAADEGAEDDLGGAHRLVEVDLAVHVEARQEEALDRGQALVAVDREVGGALPLGDVEAQGGQQPVEVEGPVAHPGHVGVAQEVVAAVDVEGPGDRAGEVADLALAVDQAVDLVRHRRVDRRQRLVDLAVGVEEDPRGPQLVPRHPRDHRLKGVAVGPVPEVVEERRGEGDHRVLVVDPIVGRDVLGEGGDPVEVAAHHVGGADRVGEARVLTAGIGEAGEAEGADPAQALDLAAVEEADDD